MGKGVIVVLAGSDGAGKTTQWKLLKKRASEEGYPTASMSFPVKDGFFGKIIYGYYLSGKLGELESLNPMDVARLYAMDREAVRDSIIKWKDEGMNIFFDRYIESNLAHQGGKGETLEEKMKIIDSILDLEVNRLGIPQADLTLYLDLPYNEKKKSVAERGDADIHEKSLKHQENTTQVYEMLLKKYKDNAESQWIRVSCLKGSERYTVEELHEIIWSIVKPRLVR